MRHRMALRSWLVAVSLLAPLACAQAEGVWSTDPVSRCQAWNPSPQPDEEIRWQGDCVDGKAQGNGTLSYLQPKKREDDQGFFWEGRLVGPRRAVETELPSGRQLSATSGYSISQTVLKEFYVRTEADPSAAPGGFVVRYYENGRAVSGYRESLTDNRERAAYLLPTGQDEDGRRRNVVYLARYNAVSDAWSSWPTAAERDAQNLNAYVVITGEPGAWRRWRCAGDAYDNCLPLFEQKLVEAGLDSLPSKRMAAIDARWQATEQDYLAQQKSRAEHQQLLVQAPADKLFTYASRMEQARNFEFALDALRAIVERFPKSSFFNLAAARMPAVQDKLTQEQDEARQANRAQQASQQAAQQAQAREQRQAVDAQQRQLLVTQQLEQRRVAWRQCSARAEQCNTDCVAQGSAGVIVGLAGLANPKSVRMEGLNAINSKAQGTCQRCDAIRAECEMLKP